jgi:hypothetical protein
MKAQGLVPIIAILVALVFLYRLRQKRYADPVSPAGYTKKSGVTYWSATKRRPVY